MFDPTSGSFGLQAQDGSFSNMNSLYMFNAGRAGGMRPSSSAMMAPQYQYLSPTNSRHTLMGLRDPTVALYDYGLWDTFKKQVLHTPLPLGMSSTDYDVGRHEYSDLIKASYGIDIAGVAASTVLFGGMPLVGGMVAGLGVMGAADFAKEKYLQNYRRTMGVAAMTSGVAGPNRPGLSGKENQDIKEFIENIGADDLLLDSKDIMNLSQFAAKNGLFKNLSDASQFKDAIKNFKDMIKTLSDFANNPDLMDIAQQIVSLRNAGFSTRGAEKFFKQTYMANQFAGMSAQEGKEAMQADLLYATNNGMDKRYFATVSADIRGGMRPLLQGGYLPRQMENASVFSAAARQGVNIAESAEYNRYGISEPMRIFYALAKSERDGVDPNKVLGELKKKPIKEQIEEVRGFGGKGETWYSEAIDDPRKLNSLLYTMDGVERLDFEKNPILNIVKEVYKDEYKRTGGRVNAQELTKRVLDYSSVEASPESRALIFSTAKEVIAHHGDTTFIEKNREQMQEAAKTRETNDRIRTYEERHGLYGRVTRTVSKWWTKIVQHMGGGSAAADNIDMVRAAHIKDKDIDPTKTPGGGYIPEKTSQNNVFSTIDSILDNKTYHVADMLKQKNPVYRRAQYYSTEEASRGIKPGGMSKVREFFSNLWHTNVLEADIFAAESIPEQYTGALIGKGGMPSSRFYKTRAYDSDYDNNIYSAGNPMPRDIKIMPLQSLDLDTEGVSSLMRIQSYKDKLQGYTHKEIFKGGDEQSYDRIQSINYIAKETKKTIGGATEALRYIELAKEKGVKAAKKIYEEDTVQKMIGGPGSDPSKTVIFGDVERVQKDVIFSKGLMKRLEEKRKELSKIPKEEKKEFIRQLQVDTYYKAYRVLSSGENMTTKARMLHGAGLLSLLSNEDLERLRGDLDGDEKAQFLIDNEAKNRPMGTFSVDEYLDNTEIKAGTKLLSTFDKYNVSPEIVEKLVKSIHGQSAEERKRNFSKTMGDLVKKGVISGEAEHEIFRAGSKLASFKDEDGDKAITAERKIGLSLYNASGERIKAQQKIIQAVGGRLSLDKDQVKNMFHILSDSQSSFMQKGERLHEFFEKVSFTKEDEDKVMSIRSTQDSAKRKELLEKYLSTKEFSEEEKTKLTKIMEKKMSDKESLSFLSDLRTKHRDLTGIRIPDITQMLDDAKIFSKDSMTTKEIYDSSGGDASKILSRIAEKSDKIDKNTGRLHEDLSAVVKAIEG